MKRKELFLRQEKGTKVSVQNSIERYLKNFVVVEKRNSMERRSLTSSELFIDRINSFQPRRIYVHIPESWHRNEAVPVLSVLAKWHDYINVTKTEKQTDSSSFFREFTMNLTFLLET
ncbi:uncharacterized protein LOC117601025 [Osmia lignaria lignaria]|uniref:uncharacterized protein LOC117601025 n=1 Tax=Osmia lignaria lignaria TaxID=1437193 RepID=UPI00402BE37F